MGKRLKGPFWLGFYGLIDRSSDAPESYTTELYEARGGVAFSPLLVRQLNLELAGCGNEILLLYYHY